MTDRPYQARTFNDVRQAIGSGKRRILVVQPTGAGKGYQCARIMEMCAAKGSENIFFAAQRELITQLGKQLSRLDIPYRTIMAGVTDEYQSYEDAVASSLCSIVAKDTLWARAFRSDKMELPPAKVLQIDEAHQSLSQTYQAIAAKYDHATILGWTATPCRTDGLSLGEYYDHLIQGATYAELQRDGYLTPVEVIAPDRPDLKGLKVSKGDYAQGDLERRMNTERLVGSIIDEWKKHSDGRQTVAFAAGIQHSIHIRNEFRRLLGQNPDGTERAEHLDGKTPKAERDDILGRVADGRVLVCCNFGVLHTGVDFPAWKYLICARPTKSFSLHRQMGGRIQRPWAGVQATIQDHSDNCHRFGYPDEDVTWTLEAGIKAEDLPRTERHRPPHEKKDPFKCTQCGTEYRGPNCPSCGHRPGGDGKDVKMSKGDLVALERAKANKAATIQDKQKKWDEVLGICIRRNLKVGAASHMYRAHFGCFPPNQLQGVPLGSQQGMNAKDFYHQVVKPTRDAAKEQAIKEAGLFSE